MSWNDRRGWSSQQGQASTARPGFGQGYEHNQTNRSARVDNSGWSNQSERTSTSVGWNSTQGPRRVDYERDEPHNAGNTRKWTGAVTELMPPNYGIVDHIAFYHSDVVEGPLPQAIGEVVDCEGIPNVDGGKYDWRLLKVSLSRSGRPGLAPSPQAVPAPTPSRFQPHATQPAAIPYNRAPTLAAPAPAVHTQQIPRAAPQLRTVGATPARRSGFDRGPPPAARPELLDDDIAARPPPSRATAPVVPVRAPVPAAAPAPLAVPKQLPATSSVAAGGGYNRDRVGSGPDRETRRPGPLPRDRMEPPRYDRDPPVRDNRPREARDNRDREPSGRDARDHPRGPPPPRDRVVEFLERSGPRDSRDGGAHMPPRSGRDSGDGRAPPPRLSGSGGPDRVVSPARGPARPPPSNRGPAGGYVTRLAKEAVHIYDRNLQSIVARYDKLYVPSEFMRCCALWLSIFSGGKRPMLDCPVRFEIAAAPPATNPTPTPRNGAAAVPVIKQEASEKDATMKHANAADPKTAETLSSGVKHEPTMAATVYTVKPKSAEGSGVEVRVNDDNATVQVKITDPKNAETGTPEVEASGADVDEEMADADDNTNTHNRSKKDSVDRSPVMRKTTRKSAAMSPGKKGGKGAKGGKRSATVDPAEAPEKDYKTLKVAQLRAELSRRDLPIKGYKAELVARLEEDDREKAKAKDDEDSPSHEAAKQGDAGNGNDGDEENKVGDEMNVAQTPDDPSATPMDVDPVGCEHKEGTPADSRAATPAATPDPQGPGAAQNCGRASKRLRRSAGGPDDSMEATAALETATSTCDDDDAPSDPAAGEEQGVRPTATPSPGVDAKPMPPSLKHGLMPPPAAADVAAGAPVHASIVDTPVGSAPGELWSARVLLMGGFPHATLHAETQRLFKHHLDLPFLVRKRAKGELQLLGGAWEPQDGGHPLKDPGALIHTAVRTVKEQSGVDLSGTGEWTKLVELQFRRPMKEMDAKIRGEGVAAPNGGGGSGAATHRSSQGAGMATDGGASSDAQTPAGAAVADAIDAASTELAAVGEYVVQRVIVFLVNAASIGEADAAALAEIRKAREATEKLKASQAELDAANAAVADQDAAAKKISMALAEKGKLGKKGAPPTLPDNISELTVADLQAELKKHGLNTEWDPAKGKSVLVDRLTGHVKAALQSNKVAAELLEQHTAASEKLQALKTAASAKEEEHSKLAEAAAAGQKLLDSPPATTVLRAQPLSDSDSLKTLTLDQLLDYTPNDTKECVFEVSMAAEAFMELLNMHYGRVLLAAATHISKAEAALRSAVKTEDELRRLEKEERASKERGAKDSKADDKVPATDVAVGSKRKAETTPHEARAALGATAKRRRAEAESLMQCTIAMGTGVPNPSPNPDTPAAGKINSGAAPSKEELPVAVRNGAETYTESILLAGRFFDEGAAGYIEAPDLEAIIHNCYPFSSRRWVRNLVEDMCRYGKLKYKDYSQVHVQYHPALLPPAGAVEPALGDIRGVLRSSHGGESTSGDASGDAMVEIDGAVVDIRGLKRTAHEAKQKLADESGIRASAEAAAAEAKAEVAKLQADLDAAVKLNLTLREEVAKMKEEKATSDAAAAKAQSKLDAIINAMK